jgi:hypothetical protein
VSFVEERNRVNARIFAVIILGIIFMLFLVGAAQIATVVPSWFLVLGILGMISLVMVAYWVYTDEERIDAIGMNLGSVDVDSTARNRISSLEERLSRLERISILEKELSEMKKAEATEKERKEPVANKAQKIIDTLLAETMIEEYRTALIERYRDSGFLHPEENLEYEISRKMALGTTRNRAIEELHKEQFA